MEFEYIEAPIHSTLKATMPIFDMFRHDSHIVEVNTQDALFREGDLGNEMYVLLEGEAEIFIGGTLFEKCGPGSIVGEIAVIEQAPRSATVIACSRCKFAVVDSKRFQFLLDETPDFAIAVMRVMAQRLKRCDIRVLNEINS